MLTGESADDGNGGENEVDFGGGEVVVRRMGCVLGYECGRGSCRYSYHGKFTLAIEMGKGEVPKTEK